MTPAEKSRLTPPGHTSDYRIEVLRTVHATRRRLGRRFLHDLAAVAAFGALLTLIGSPGRRRKEGLYTITNAASGMKCCIPSRSTGLVQRLGASARTSRVTSAIALIGSCQRAKARWRQLPAL